MGISSAAHRAARAVRHPRAAAERVVHLRRDHRIARWQVLHTGTPQLVTVRTRDGILTFDTRDSVIGQSLYLYRHWEHDLMARTLRALRANGLRGPERRTLVDVGANIGTTTVAFLRQKAFDRGVAVEPEPQNFNLLRRNLRQNGLDDRVACVAVAVGEAPGSLELALSPTNLGDHRIRVTDADGDFDEASWPRIRVPVERLDDVLRREEVLDPCSVGLVWVDVQGYEPHVLEGAEEVISLGVPVEMELWPYGIARAGTTPGAFVALATSLFPRFIDLSDPALVQRPIADLVPLFEMLNGPDGSTEILLLPG